MNQLNTNKKLQKEPENNKSESKAYSPKRQQHRQLETPKNAVNSAINQKTYNTSSFLEKLSLPRWA